MIAVAWAIMNPPAHLRGSARSQYSARLWLPASVAAHSDAAIASTLRVLSHLFEYCALPLLLAAPFPIRRRIPSKPGGKPVETRRAQRNAAIWRLLPLRSATRCSIASGSLEGKRIAQDIKLRGPAPL